MTDDAWVEVTGHGSASTRSDVVHAQLASEAVAGDVATAFGRADAGLRAMVAAVRSAGVGDGDLRTSGMSLDRHHDRQGTPSGYRAWLGLDVVLRDMASVGDSAARAARDAAWESARGQAEQLAGLAGRELGEVLHICDQAASGWPRPIGGGGRQAMAMAARLRSNPAAPR